MREREIERACVGVKGSEGERERERERERSDEGIACEREREREVSVCECGEQKKTVTVLAYFSIYIKTCIYIYENSYFGIYENSRGIILGYVCGAALCGV
jgi:hypothetical protein